MTYEYKVLSVDTDTAHIESVLAYWGAEGWKLVGATDRYIILMRET